MQIDDKLHDHGFAIIDNFLAQKDYESLTATAKSMHENGQFRSAKIGHQLDAKQNSTIRKDKLCWLEENSKNSAIEAYTKKMHAISEHLNRSLFLGLNEFEAHFAIYPPGAFYKKHIDQFNSTKTRRISCVYYLNENWQNDFGGELKLYSQDDRLLATVLPEANRFICFNSDLPHEVCETKRTRYSIAAWMKTRELAFVL